MLYTLPAHLGERCHFECKMGGGTGQCQTDFCGVGDVACCKTGLQQPPCDGVTGCGAFQCCTSLRGPPLPTPLPSRPPPSPTTPPRSPFTPPLALPPTPIRGSCDDTSLTYLLEETKQEEDGITYTTASVLVTPWREMLRVVLMLRGEGEYIDVLDAEGAMLGKRDQVGPFMRLAFDLEDEPTEGCESACFRFDAIGHIRPESLSCTMNPEFVDPPPLPPPRYVSNSELERLGLSSIEVTHLPAPPPQPPPPHSPLLSSGVLILNGTQLPAMSDRGGMSFQDAARSYSDGVAGGVVGVAGGVVGVAGGGVEGSMAGGVADGGVAGDAVDLEFVDATKSERFPGERLVERLAYDQGGEGGTFSEDEYDSTVETEGGAGEPPPLLQIGFIGICFVAMAAVCRVTGIVSVLYAAMYSCCATLAGRLGITAGRTAYSAVVRNAKEDEGGIGCFNVDAPLNFQDHCF